MTDKDDAYYMNVEIELYEAYILNDKTRIAYLEAIMAEYYATMEN